MTDADEPAETDLPERERAKPFTSSLAFERSLAQWRLNHPEVAQRAGKRPKKQVKPAKGMPPEF